MSSVSEIVLASILLAVFLGVVYYATQASRQVSAATSQANTQLKSKGYDLNAGKLQVKTDKVAPSREEYIASTQRAFAQGAKAMAAHPEAFSTGRTDGSSSDTGKAGFKRGKKTA